MYSSNMDYYRATSLNDAIKALAQNKGAKLLAGGHSLIPAMKLRVANPSMLVDIGRIRFRGRVLVTHRWLRGELCSHLSKRRDATPSPLTGRGPG